MIRSSLLKGIKLLTIYGTLHFSHEMSLRNILRCSAVVWSASKNFFSIMPKYGHDCKYEIYAFWLSYVPNMIKI